MSDTEELKPATVLREVQAFIGIMFGRGPDAIIPETVATPVGPSVNLGDIMRGVAAVIEREERVPPGVETEGVEAAERILRNCYGPGDRFIEDDAAKVARALLSTSSRGEDGTSLAMTPASLPASNGIPSEWRPIESAPKDGTHVLLFAPAWPAPNTGWTFGFDDWQNCPYHHAGNPSWKPTHWMPLPSAPVGSAPPSNEGGSRIPNSFGDPIK